MRRRVIELIVVRHAIACERDPVRWKDDRMRPLTAEGRKRFRKAARGLGRFIGKPDRVLTSRLVRAVQTAEILEKAAGWPAATSCPELEPNSTPARTLNRLRAEGRARIVIVGHEPHLSRFAGACIAGASARTVIELKKGAAAILRFERRIGFGSGTLLALLPPRALRKLRPGIRA
jgi:phosphohistidine phosphatase